MLTNDRPFRIAYLLRLDAGHSPSRDIFRHVSFFLLVFMPHYRVAWRHLRELA